MKTKEDIMAEMHNEFMNEVAESGVPVHMIEYYGMPNFNPDERRELPVNGTTFDWEYPVTDLPLPFRGGGSNKNRTRLYRMLPFEQMSLRDQRMMGSLKKELNYINKVTGFYKGSEEE